MSFILEDSDHLSKNRRANKMLESRNFVQSIIISPRRKRAKICGEENLGSFALIIFLSTLISIIISVFFCLYFRLLLTIFCLFVPCFLSVVFPLLSLYLLLFCNFCFLHLLLFFLGSLHLSFFNIYLFTF